MKIINREKDSQRVMPKDFIGPSSISLEMANIISVDPDLKIPNIREPYTLTDKADGLRKLLFINSIASCKYSFPLFNSVPILIIASLGAILGLKIL